MSPKRQAKEHARRRPARIPGYTSEHKTAEELNVAVRTLRLWRRRGMGPPWTAVGRQIFYADESRAAWLKSREVQPVRS
jgi:hypothetical protein